MSLVCNPEFYSGCGGKAAGDMCSKCGRRLRTKKNYIDDTMCIGQVVFFKNKTGAIDSGYLALIRDKKHHSMARSIFGLDDDYDELYNNLKENEVLVRSKQQNQEKFDQVHSIDDISSSVLTVRIERRTPFSPLPSPPPSSTKKLSKSQVKRAKKKAKISAAKLASAKKASATTEEENTEFATVGSSHSSKKPLSSTLMASSSPLVAKEVTPTKQASTQKTKVSPTKSVGKSAKKLTPKITPKKAVVINSAAKADIFSPTRPRSPKKSPKGANVTSMATSQDEKTKSKGRSYCIVS